jgi:XTP/dITP diphosphohydrolase
MKICFATNNRHKLEEVAKAVPPTIQIVSLTELSVFEDLPETQNSFQGNALQKARFVFDHYNVPCFADDSGLEVEALNNEPGIFSARYAGPQRNDTDNIDLLLKKLTTTINRKARFITVIALVGFGETCFFEGVIEGDITLKPVGTNGFGYDPIFRPGGSTRTFAEMSLIEKNTLSHRAIAVKKLVAHLKQLHLR